MVKARGHHEMRTPLQRYRIVPLTNNTNQTINIMNKIGNISEPVAQNEPILEQIGRIRSGLNENRSLIETIRDRTGSVRMESPENISETKQDSFNGCHLEIELDEIIQQINANNVLAEKILSELRT